MANRFWARTAVGGVWLACWWDDFLLLPVALPPLLWIHGRLGWRPPSLPPRWSEIGLHWLVWSVACEVLAPLVWAAAVGDWRDVVAYGLGALLAGWWWNRPRARQTPVHESAA